MQIPTFEHEERLIKEGLIPIGVDEAGRGPLAGPVIAAAALFKNQTFAIPAEREKEFRLIRDSKKLSPKQREQAFALVQEFFHVGVGIIGPETIDRVNILEATFLAMKSALSTLRKQLAKNNEQGSEEHWTLLIDGNQIIPNLTHEQQAIVNGDGLVRSIAAASIMAKVTRDRMIVEADALYPGYGLALHKGYGTAAHMAALRKLGPSLIHRMSFRPVQLAIPENVNKRFEAVLKPRRK